MVWIVPDDLEDVVRAATRAALGEAALATSSLTAAIVDRSRRYTSERDRLSVDRPGDLAARAAFFTIADAMKIAIPLGELGHRGALPAARPLRILDLGAGCGAMSLGAIVVLDELARAHARDAASRSRAAATSATSPTTSATSPGTSATATGTVGTIATPVGATATTVGATAATTTGPAPALAPALDIIAIDRDGPALAIARAAIRDLAARRGLAVSLTTRDDDVTRARLPPADLVIAGTVLNELPAAARLELALRALAAIGDDGAVILVEPALRETSRALHELRDAIIASGRGHVFAPCTRTAAPCPALADPSDWCHEDRPLQLPRRTAELARLTHLRDGGMKLAYLVLRRQPLALVDAAPAWRVVSAPMPAKGKLELIGCSAAGRIPIRLLRRHRTSANRGFESARRGDVLVTTAEVGADRVEITDATPVERLTPAERDKP